MMGANTGSLSNNDVVNVNAVNINGNTDAGGKWGIFKSSQAGLLTVRNYGSCSSVLNLWAPPGGIGYNIDKTNREATLSLVRADSTETESEFIDFYNQDYASCGREAGIRIQKRGNSTNFPEFKFEFSDGVTLYEAMKFIPPKSGTNKTIIEINSHVSVLNNRISNLQLPVDDEDAANKLYVDEKLHESCFYKLQEDLLLFPVIQKAFFKLTSNVPCFWSGDLKSGTYRFHLSFVTAKTDQTDIGFIILKIQDKLLLCQQIRGGSYQHNDVYLVLETDKEQNFSILLTKSEDSHTPLSSEVLQLSSVLVEVQKL